MFLGTLAPSFCIAFAAAVICLAEENGEPSCPAGDNSCKLPGLSSSSVEGIGQPGTRVFSVEELALHDGSDPDRPVLLAIIGEVYDVTAGRRFYAKDGDYGGLSGRDASRAFSTGEFKNNGTASDISGLSEEDVSEVLGWRSFYRQHKEYTFLGVLAERYFDENANPTNAHKKVEAMSRAADVAGAMKEELKKRFPSCNTRHEAVNSYFEIWCDDGYHGKGSKPVHLYYQMPSSGSRKAEDGSWCACLTKTKRKAAEAEAAEQLKKPQHGVPTFRLVDYPECNKKKHCKRQKGSQPP